MLIILALKQGVQNLQIFGDSQLVINWVSSKFRINNIVLTQVLQEVIRISNFLVKLIASIFIVNRILKLML